MFKGEFQGGPAVELLTPQGSRPFAKWKTVAGSSKKQYNSLLRGYAFALVNAKIQLPGVKESNGLWLIQPILAIQMNVPEDPMVSIELNVTDTNQKRHRLLFSTASREAKVTSLHARIPLHMKHQNAWTTVCIDVAHYVQEFFQAELRSLEGIIIASPKSLLRRVFTLKNTTTDTGDPFPQQYAFASDVPSFIQYFPKTQQRIRIQDDEPKKKTPRPPKTAHHATRSKTRIPVRLAQTARAGRHSSRGLTTRRGDRISSGSSKSSPSLRSNGDSQLPTTFTFTTAPRTPPKFKSPRGLGATRPTNSKESIKQPDLTSDFSSSDDETDSTTHDLSQVSNDGPGDLRIKSPLRYSSAERVTQRPSRGANNALDNNAVQSELLVSNNSPSSSNIDSSNDEIHIPGYHSSVSLSPRSQLDSDISPTLQHNPGVPQTSVVPLNLDGFQIASDEFLEEEGWRYISDDESEIQPPASFNGKPKKSATLSSKTKPLVTLSIDAVTEGREDGALSPLDVTLQQLISPEPQDINLKLSLSGSGFASQTSFSPAASTRAYSPPVSFTRHESDHLELNPHTIQTQQELEQKRDSVEGGIHQHDQRDNLDLIFDPVLNCYYDPVTKQYYELV